MVLGEPSEDARPLKGEGECDTSNHIWDKCNIIIGVNAYVSLGISILA